MYRTPDTMTSLQYLRPGTAAGGRLKQIQEAKDMEKAVRDRANRLNINIPPYDLLELIGKGTFGRVFKSRRHKERSLVAVKIIDVDSSDYKLDPREKDQAIKDFTTEINILLTLKEADAKNINVIYEAFSFHSQLWIVSEYCPGGSVHTLMKASPRPGLDERYIIAISRELAVAMKYVHQVGVIHRDIKAANILITQEGRLQLCDFGVSGVLESNVAKRSTIVGTPFWMPPEMHENYEMPQGYGTEIDTWAYGCTVYELATGLPPNARLDPRRLGIFLKHAPRLEGDEYSLALKDFVSFCLTERPESRPTADIILEHPYIYNTSKKYPTTILRELIDRFNGWEQAGGQRASLFNPLAGAAGPSQLDPHVAADDDWNFSSDDLDQDYRDSSTESEGPLSTADDGASIKTLTPHQRYMEEQRVLRGGEKMNRLFDPSAPAYEYTHDDGEDDVPLSDLPLRNLSAPDYAGHRTTLIDLDDAIDLDLDAPSIADAATVRANRLEHFLHDDDEDEEVDSFHPTNYTKRATREWKFPVHMTAPANEFERPSSHEANTTEITPEPDVKAEVKLDSPLLYVPTGATLAPAFRPTLVHSNTAPNFGELLRPQNSTMNGQLSSSPTDRTSAVFVETSDPITRPSTAASSTGESSFTDVTTTDPFDLESRLEASDARARARASFHLHTTSDSTTASFSSVAYHDRGPSFSSDSEYEREREQPLSVKDSIDSLRQAAATDDYWVSDVRARLNTRNRVVPSHGQVHAQGFSHNHGYGHPRQAGSGSGSGSGHSRAPTSTTTSFSSDVWAAYDHAAAAAAAAAELAPLTALPSASHTFPDAGAVAAAIASSPPRVPAKPYPAGARSARPQFPEVLSPDPVALEEDASAEVVMSELERLLDDFAEGMRFVEDLFSDERERTGVDAGTGLGAGAVVNGSG